MATKPPRPLLGDAACLRRPPSFQEVRWYRRAAGVPWYRSVTAITALVTAGETGFLAVLVVVPRLVDVDTFSPEARLLLLLILPLVYAAATGGAYLYWMVWRLRDVRLWRFAVLNGMFFSDAVETNPKGWGTALTGTGFPKNRRIVMRAVFGRDEQSLGQIMVGRSHTGQNTNGQSPNLRRPFAFARMDLPAKSPHIIVRPEGSHVLSLAGLGLNNRSSLILEADPDCRFSVLCPRGFEQEARRLFTAEVLRMLWATARSCELELIDDELYLYFSHSTPLWRPEAMDRLQTTLALVNERVAERLPRRFDSQRPGRSGDESVRQVGNDYADSSRRVDLSGRRIIDKDAVSAMTWIVVGGIVLLNCLVGFFVRFVLPTLLRG